MLREYWARVRDGHSLALLGFDGLPPHLGDGEVEVVQVGGDAPRPGQPILDALALLRSRIAPSDAAWSRTGRLVTRRLRDRLLGAESPEPEALRAALEALADTLERPVAVVVRVRQGALEPVTRGLLADVFQGAGIPGVAFVLLVQDPGRAEHVDVAGLLAILRRHAGDAAVVEHLEVPPPVDLTALGSEVARVLRAGAFVGPVFDVATVGMLVGATPTSVLESLQRATDLGVPLLDAGDERLALPSDVHQWLASTLLPSLATRWQQALDALLDPEAELATDDDAMGEVVDLFGPATARPLRVLPALAESVDDPAPAAAVSASSTDASGTAERLLGAFHQAAAHDPERAISVARTLLQFLSQQEGDGARRTTMSLLGEAAALQWRHAGRGDLFTLARALGTVDGALGRADVSDPVELVVELRVLAASILFDMGDRAGLERALTELADAARLLESVGEVVRAAMHLNERAAVWLRLGDPARAAELLKRSRAVFAAQAETDPLAQREVGQTDHLLARLPLHVPHAARIDAEIMDRALDRAAAARDVFSRLEDARSVARVDETVGRLLLLDGQPSAALQVLGRVAEVQEGLGDLLGLARTTEALSRAMTRAGRPEEALATLADSVTLNLAEGSAIGLAYVLRAFEQLVSSLDPALTATLADTLEEVRRRIAVGQASVGEVTLGPGA